jgi:hypothetical protein
VAPKKKGRGGKRNRRNEAHHFSHLGSHVEAGGKVELVDKFVYRWGAGFGVAH